MNADIQTEPFRSQPKSLNNRRKKLKKNGNSIGKTVY